MKKIIFFVIALVLFSCLFVFSKKSIQLGIKDSNDKLTIQNRNKEHFENNLELYNEVIPIIKNNFASPLDDSQPFLIYDDEFTGFGYKVDPFIIDKINFSYNSYILCEYDSLIYSMCDGFVKNIYTDSNSKNNIIIEYNEDIDILHIGITEKNIKIGDKIIKGQLLGMQIPNYTRGNGINGKGYFLVKIKYKGVFLNPYILLNDLVSSRSGIN